jgi:hypothetical protein
MRGYFIHFLLAVLVLAGMLAGFNWWVDPYGIYRDRATLLQQSNPILVMNERVFKTVGLARTPADIVLLGTSRTDIGIGRDNPAFAGKRVLNLATFGQPIRETRRLMEIAVMEGRTKTIIVGLDFFAFNTLFAPPSDYVEENYNPLRPYTLMLSVSSLSDAWAVTRRKVPAEGDCCFGDGFRTPTKREHLAGSYQQQFAANERMYLLEKYLPYPACDFSFDTRDGKTSLDDFREMLSLAHQHHIDLRFFISPSHARQWETLAVAGLWDKWEAWKRKLVELNHQAAVDAAGKALPLWDFSGYDAVSTEAVPSAIERERLMRWYSDSSHYTPDLGIRIMQRVFGQSVQDVPADWGRLLHEQQIDTWLVQQRAARAQYRLTHASDMAEIDKIAQEVARVKHCPSRQ